MFRFLVEVDPNLVPQQYRIVWIQRLDGDKNPDDPKNWITLATTGDLKSLTQFTPVDELATAAYGYAITNTADIESHGYFIFGEKVDAPK